jgi:quercetin dioxygenase-like cupin family protein
MDPNEVFADGNARDLSSLVEVAPGAIVSRVLVKNPQGNLTLFAFDEGQALSEHTAPFEAFVQVLEGALELTVGGKKVAVAPGQVGLMPAGVPHALLAQKRTKWLLTMIKA